MKVKGIQLVLTEAEFEAIEIAINSLLVDPRQELFYHASSIAGIQGKVKAIRQRLNTAQELSKKFPIREG